MTDDTQSAAQRMVHALATAETFNRAQVAHIVSLALGVGDDAELSYRAGFDAGYWARVAEENAAYPPAPHRLVTTAGQDAVRVHRARAGVDVVEPREGDFPGWGMAAVEALRAGAQ